MSWWKEESDRVIAAQLEEYQAGGLTGDALKRAIGRHYPFGERRYWPYKVWLRQLALALGQPGPVKKTPTVEDIPGQMLLGLGAEQA